MTKETFKIKAALWISCAAFLALSSQKGIRPFVSRMIVAVLSIFVFKKLPLTVEKAKRYFTPWCLMLGTLLCAAGGYHFYKSWQTSNKVNAAAEWLGINGKILLAAMSAAGTLTAIPFAVCVFGWLTGVLINYDEGDTRGRAYMFIILAVAFASSLPVFMRGMTYGDDWHFHLLRIESIAQGVMNGEFPVRMNGIIDNDYGYPVSIFYGDILLYIPALLRIMGFTLDFAYKTYIVLINLFTAIISCLCFSRIISRENAIVATVAYMTASYRLVNIYVRSAVGEYTAMMLFPIILLALWYIYYKTDAEREAVLLLSIGMTGLLYTHLLSVEMAIIVIAIVAVTEYKKTFTKNRLLIYSKAVVLTLILGASYWIPMLDYYFSCDTAIKQISGQPKLIQGAGSNISNYFAFFRHSKRYDGAVFQRTPGLVLMGALLLALWIIFVKTEKNKIIGKLTGYAVVFLVMASNVFPWDEWAQSNPLGQFMSQIQFPWRYIGVACIVLAFLLGYILENTCIQQDKRALLSKIALICAFLMCFHFMSTFEEGASQSKFTSSADLDPRIGAEYILNGVNIDHLPRKVSVAQGKGEIIKENGVNKDVYVEAPADSTVRFPVFCYPYYEVTDESGKTYEIFEGRNRTVKIQLDGAYKGMLYLRFKEPWYWRVSEAISIISIICTAICVIKYRKERRNEE